MVFIDLKVGHNVFIGLKVDHIGWYLLTTQMSQTLSYSH